MLDLIRLLILPLFFVMLGFAVMAIASGYKSKNYGKKQQNAPIGSREKIQFGLQQIHFWEKRSKYIFITFICLLLISILAYVSEQP